LGPGGDRLARVRLRPPQILPVPRILTHPENLHEIQPPVGRRPAVCTLAASFSRISCALRHWDSDFAMAAGPLDIRKAGAASNCNLVVQNTFPMSSTFVLFFFLIGGIGRRGRAGRKFSSGAGFLRSRVSWAVISSAAKSRRPDRIGIAQETRFVQQRLDQLRAWPPNRGHRSIARAARLLGHLMNGLALTLPE